MLVWGSDEGDVNYKHISNSVRSAWIWHDGFPGHLLSANPLHGKHAQDVIIWTFSFLKNTTTETLTTFAPMGFSHYDANCYSVEYGCPNQSLEVLSISFPFISSPLPFSFLFISLQFLPPLLSFISAIARPNFECRVIIILIVPERNLLGALIWPKWRRRHAEANYSEQNCGRCWPLHGASKRPACSGELSWACWFLMME